VIEIRQNLITGRLKMTNMKMTDHIAGHENAEGHHFENETHLPFLNFQKM